jgi:hypothetical protein
LQECHLFFIVDLQLYNIKELACFYFFCDFCFEFLVLLILKLFIFELQLFKVMLFDVGDWASHHNLLIDVNFIIFSEYRVTQKIKRLHPILWVEDEALAHEVNEFGGVVGMLKHLKVQEFAQL